MLGGISIVNFRKCLILMTKSAVNPKGLCLKLLGYLVSPCPACALWILDCTPSWKAFWRLNTTSRPQLKGSHYQHVSMMSPFPQHSSKTNNRGGTQTKSCQGKENQQKHPHTKSFRHIACFLIEHREAAHKTLAAS